VDFAYWVLRSSDIHLTAVGKTIRKDLRDLSALLLDMGIVVLFVKDGLGVY
jgi:hypothetical protein